MELTQKRTFKILAILVLLAAIIQPLYTLLFQQFPDVNRQILWRFEALIFVLMAAFAGAAMVQDKRYALGFAAIAFSTVLNVTQVGIGLLQFGPFRAATQTYEALGPVAFSVIALSFFLYNAAKALLGLAAIVFGMEKLKNGGTLLGALSLATGSVALITNALVMMFGIRALSIGTLQIKMVAGASGVVATLFLALCLFTLKLEDKTDS